LIDLAVMLGVFILLFSHFLYIITRNLFSVVDLTNKDEYIRMSTQWVLSSCI